MNWKTRSTLSVGWTGMDSVKAVEVLRNVDA